MNECIPKYSPGQDLTAHVAQSGGVTGKRLLAISANKQGVEAVSDDTSGGNIVVSYPSAGGAVVGVAGYDTAEGAKTTLVRGAGKVVPITAGGTISAGQEVEATTTGKVVALGTAGGGIAIGRAWRDAVNNGECLVELYVGGKGGGQVEPHMVHLTDNSTGTASDTIASISDAATKNAVASLAAKVNGILAALEDAGIMEAS